MYKTHSSTTVAETVVTQQPLSFFYTNRLSNYNAGLLSKKYGRDARRLSFKNVFFTFKLKLLLLFFFFLRGITGNQGQNDKLQKDTVFPFLYYSYSFVAEPFVA